MKVLAVSAAVLCAGFDVESRGKGAEDKQPDAPLILIPPDRDIRPADGPGARSDVNCINDGAWFVALGSVEVKIRCGVLRISRIIILENAG
ncbi:hypothetical protein [Mesorhizobium sp. BH1-1-4]|uniref:hypothetical protein n=1 Tax=Mesorhizobium sp. BH1-1-4 TaxID=2876662 RepID=UPI001CD14BB1|nr:hypothetical protein [Mesorhizobium sp. BH1-1-4]MBZ9997196.1 hypothetical protein [Mesorhizobium sp. BH1-1-4]